jgi:hypothetical protein
MTAAVMAARPKDRADSRVAVHEGAATIAVGERPREQMCGEE